MAGRPRRINKRGDAANVARGPTGSPRSVLAPPARQLRRRIIHSVSAEIANRADFLPAPVCFRVGGYGDSAKASTPLNWLANVAFCPPARVNLRRKTQSRGCRNAPSAQCPLQCLSSPADGVDSGRAATEPTVSKQHRRPTSLPRVVSVLSEWKNATENRSEKTRPRRHCARKFGSFAHGLSTPAEKNQGDAANVARGRIGSP